MVGHHAKTRNMAALGQGQGAWKYADGKTWWPDNDGFHHIPEDRMLDVGTPLDRYGDNEGSFFALEGTPIDQRALAPHVKTTPDNYRRYVVVKPLSVQSGTATSWFGKAGGGPQFKTNMTVDELLDGGFIDYAD